MRKTYVLRMSEKYKTYTGYYYNSCYKLNNMYKPTPPSTKRKPLQNLPIVKFSMYF